MQSLAMTSSKSLIILSYHHLTYLQKPHCLINTILILHLVRGRQFQGNMPSEVLGHSGQAPVLGGQ